MKKIIALISIAIALGIMVMLIPIAVFTPFLVTTQYSQESSLSDDDYSAPIRKVDEAAQTYGKIDVGPVFFPSSLFHATLIVAAGLITGLSVWLYFKKRTM
ncbi:MAG: hypothetical protein QXX08_01520 [Candidatus Bathyarchaeia archaeon]